MLLPARSRFGEGRSDAMGHFEMGLFEMGLDFPSTI